MSTDPPTSSSSHDVTILSHPLPKMGDKNTAGKLHVYGDPKTAKHVIIMSAGYPDNQQAFVPMAQRLASDNCLVGVTCPPGYDDSLDWKDYPKDGFTFDDWAVNLREAVKVLREYSSQPIEETTLTGIFHDWGVVMGTMYTNQAEQDDPSNQLGLKVDRLVIFDVLMPPHPETDNRPKGHENKTMWQKTCQMSYQLGLALAHLLQRYIPLTYVSVIFFTLTSRLMSLLGMLSISEQDNVYIHEHIKLETIGQVQRVLYMAYPYFQFWKQIWKGKIRELVSQIALPKHIATTPVLYIYGSSKPYDLSDANGVALLQREHEEGRPSRVVRVENAGHWTYASELDTCYTAIREFFAACQLTMDSK